MDVLRSRFQTIARCVLLVVILVAPWCLGGVEFESQRWLYAGVLVSFGCWGLATILPARDGSLWFPALAVPLVGALLVGAVQLLPANCLTAAATARATEHDVADADQSQEPRGRTNPRSLRIDSQSATSFSPADTRICQSHLLMALLAVFLAAELLASPQYQPWLWVGLAVDGAALATFGIVQKINWNGQLFWSIPLSHGGSPFASYVNRNNATGFLNIALGAAVGWVIWALTCPVGQTDDSSFSGQWPNIAAWRRERVRNILASAAGGHRRVLLFGAITAASLIVAGIVCSLSRSGFIGAVGGALAALVLLAGRRKLIPAAAILACVVLVGVTVVTWTGLGRSVERRLTTLFGEHKLADARLSNWHDALQAARAFPVLGTGYGTYQFAYRPFQSRHHDVWFQHAENQYVQALVEGGVVGLGLLILAIGLVFRDLIRLARRGSISRSDAVAACGLFAIVSQCLQGIFDFGLYLPANMLALATICGAAAGSARAALESVHTRARPEFGVPCFGILRLGSVLVLSAWGWVAWNEVSSAAAAHRAVASVPQLTSMNSCELADLDVRLGELNAAVQMRPDDAELHGKIAEVWIYRYRRLAVQRLQSEGAADQKLWDLTDLGVLHRQANQRFRFDPPGSVERLRESAPVSENLTPAVAHLLEARAACSLLPEVDIQLAALAFVRNPAAPQGETEILRATKLAPTEPVVLYEAGVLARQAGLNELCFSLWKRSLALSPVRQRQIMNDVRGWAKIDEILEKVLPDDPEVVLDVLARDYAAAHFAVEKSLLMKRVREIAEERRVGMTAPQLQHLQGRIAVMEGRVDEALEFFQRAVALAPFEAAWRFELAQMLKKQGRAVEAREQAEICLSLQGDVSGVAQFLEGLARRESRPPPASASGARSTTATYLSRSDGMP